MNCAASNLLREEGAEGHLEPEGDAGQQSIHSEVDALLQGAVQAHAGPVALPPQQGGDDKLEAVGAAGLQLSAAQQLARRLGVTADSVLCWVT